MDYFDEQAGLAAGAEPAPLSLSDTQTIMQELMGGAATPKMVKIYTHTQLDPAASRVAGRRIYREMPYILAKYSANDDGVSRPVTEEDKLRYPKAWAHYERSIGDSNQPLVGMLPGCGAALARELTDMGLGRISALAVYTGPLPQYLEIVRWQAIRWHALSEEEHGDPEKDTQQDGPGDCAGSPGGFPDTGTLAA